MPKTSAGLLVYQFHQNHLQVLLVHPGGPFWKNKDEGAWSIPKGEYSDSEDPLQVALREFEEETGNNIEATNFIELEAVKQKGSKLIKAWAVEANIEQPFISSNIFEMEWPPRSGKMQQFPEVDKAGWFSISEAAVKMNAVQFQLVQQLQEKLGAKVQ
ncbi:NUDIX domain-containing protein [Aridibaculum aurantiacum]|uniref:NUDIX domain-containing protein n=1 Tax=Aridibaculum aurantiacum TaxID=2810307 RepID=UPI001A976F42|nr:NUDIX domain-containing protein [Aridibaculum aurantiacum]